jgi:hypothetical protein
MATFNPPAYTDETSPSNYANSFDKRAHVLLKPELTDPTTQWPHRQWYRIVLQLQGTQVLLRQTTVQLLCERPLSLQAAQVGLATGYQKKTFVFRMRVEGYQFLCAAASFAAAVSWVDTLNAAIAVSIDLDERKEPRYPTMATTPALATPNSSIRTSSTSKLSSMWRVQRSSLNGTWLGDRVSEHGNTDFERSLEDEALILTTHSTPQLQKPTTNYCFSVCHDTACAVSSPDLKHCTSMRMALGLESTILFDTKEVADATPWQVGRVDLAWRGLEYARRCAETLTYRASWKNTRCLRGQSWVEMKVKVSNSTTALAG